MIYKLDPEFDPNSVPDPVIGYLDRDGSIRCENCLSTPARVNMLWDGVEPCRVFASNIRPYKQECHVCDATLFDEGTSGVTLFEKDPARVLLPTYAKTYAETFAGIEITCE
mgnify:CR=1 FL=1